MQASGDSVKLNYSQIVVYIHNDTSVEDVEPIGNDTLRLNVQKRSAMTFLMVYRIINV